jgi:hypothetical protein
MALPSNAKDLFMKLMSLLANMKAKQAKIQRANSG